MEAGLLTLFIGGGFLFLFGYSTAVMHRANSDYKKTKEILPGLRKGFWLALWKVIKVGFWIIMALVILIIVEVAKVRGHS